MKRFVIERHIPGVGRLSPAQFKELAARSNGAVAKLAGGVQWVHSYVAADNTFCVYLGESEEHVREHSRLAEFPITRVNEIVTVIDPVTAFS
jgi:Nickel responsive protein SCO4226-like